MGDSENRPEPPARWNPENPGEPGQTEPSNENQAPNRQGASHAAYAVIGRVAFDLSADEQKVFQSARNYITASQVTAVFSLFFGGVLLSSIAVALGCVAYAKLNQLAVNRGGDPELQHVIRRSGAIVIAIAAFALVLNIIALVFLYPAVMETLQGTDLGALTGSAPSTNSPGSSTWG